MKLQNQNRGNNVGALAGAAILIQVFEIMKYIITMGVLIPTPIPTIAKPPFRKAIPN
jgi:hypothetical protein